jgi:multicomponent Na+:H+ antiporter subunit G
MAMELTREIVQSIFLVTGCAFVLVSAIGLARMRTFPERMHAGGKAGALGLGLLLAGEVVDAGSWQVALKGVLALVLLFLTFPIASHALMRTWWREHGSPVDGDCGDAD